MSISDLRSAPGLRAAVGSLEVLSDVEQGLSVGHALIRARHHNGPEKGCKKITINPLDFNAKSIIIAPLRFPIDRN
jgi:hypothetical protein